MRWVALALCLVVACKKKEPEAEPAAPTTPSTGHSSTKLAGHADPEEGAAVEGRAPAPGSAHAAVPVDAGEEADAQLYGGNGKPPYRDEDGHLHGPGGPVFMGRGPECTNKIDHCLRDGVWFAVGNVQRGKLYRATPVFEFENKWWSWRGDEQTDWHLLFKTKAVDKASDLKAGTPVIWLIEENSSSRLLSSEHDALTTSRWEAGVIESVGAATFKVDGWDHAIQIDTARTIVQQKKPS